MRLKSVKLIIPLILLAGIVAGCQTPSVESRKRERAAAYAAFPADVKTLVDGGQIKTGMTADAVYIAWGKPAEILPSETEQGRQTAWLYYGGWMEETRYWGYRQVGAGDQLCLERYLATDYQPRTYVSAEIIFVDGVVKRWRMLPRPTY
jgi:hypothetical protein